MHLKRTSLEVCGSLSLSLIFLYLLGSVCVAVAVRDKLESLCRELQRQNKVLMVSSAHWPSSFVFDDSSVCNY